MGAKILIFICGFHPYFVLFLCVLLPDLECSSFNPLSISVFLLPPSVSCFPGRHSILFFHVVCFLAPLVESGSGLAPISSSLVSVDLTLSRSRFNFSSRKSRASISFVAHLGPTWIFLRLCFFAWIQFYRLCWLVDLISYSALFWWQQRHPGSPSCCGKSGHCPTSFPARRSESCLCSSLLHGRVRE
jgi:hypothetical protein